MKKKCDKTKCPFIKEPFEECYCSQMNSHASDKVITYCGGNYEECDIYKKHIKDYGNL
ncbi:MAG: hypothetical protein H6Q92_344 [Nitrospirae bacterium]|nr:hypothetical protein [Nitrospirota bacterium]